MSGKCMYGIGDRDGDCRINCPAYVDTHAAEFYADIHPYIPVSKCGYVNSGVLPQDLKRR